MFDPGNERALLTRAWSLLGGTADVLGVLAIEGS
jgi:hypothetical protein